MRPTATRFVRASGYWRCPVGISAATAAAAAAPQSSSGMVVQLWVSEPAKQTNLIVVGGPRGVALRPGAGFSTRTAAGAVAATYSYALFLPKGGCYVQVRG